MLDIDTVTPPEAAEKLGRFVGKLDHYRRTTLKAVLEEHASAMSAAELLKPVLEKASAHIAHNVGKRGEQCPARLRDEDHEDEGKRVIEA